MAARRNEQCVGGRGDVKVVVLTMGEVNKLVSGDGGGREKIGDGSDD